MSSPRSSINAGEGDAAPQTAARVQDVYARIGRGDPSTLATINRGFAVHKASHSEAAVAPLWKEVVRSAFNASLTAPHGVLFSRLNILAIGGEDGAPSHIRVVPVGRTRLLQNIHPNPNVTSLVELDLTQSIRSLHPRDGAVAGSHQVDLDLEWGVVSDGFPIQSNGGNEFELATLGALEMRVGGIVQAATPMLAESRTRNKLRVALSNGWSRASLTIRLRGAVSVQIFSAAVSHS